MIRLENVCKNFGDLQVLKNVNLEVKEGEKLVIIGPSGSGKSTTVRCMNFLEEPTSGHVYIDGQKLTHANKTKIIRESISMVFQQFNLYPHMTVLKNLTIAPMKLHHKSKKEAEDLAYHYLDVVGLRDKAHVYPTTLSGGQQQRIAIARALLLKPSVLLLDEPFSALDENLREDMRNLVLQLQREFHMTVILVTHDLGIAAEVGDRIQVMYAGEIIETGTKSEIFKKAVHPYTWALMKSVPSAQSQTEEKLYSLKGTPPDLIAPPKACAFAPRCEYCMGICRRLHPVMAAESESHSAGCWLMHPDAPKPEQLGKGGTI